MCRAAGYAMPPETMSAQFYQTVHPDNCSEIIVIYVKDLSRVDLTVGEAMPHLHERAALCSRTRPTRIASKALSLTA